LSIFIVSSSLNTPAAAPFSKPFRISEAVGGVYETLITLSHKRPFMRPLSRSCALQDLINPQPILKSKSHEVKTR
jgi:hypothetical protein